MNSREMHYDVKVKLNKVDSQQYANLQVPEIDWALNGAQDIFIKNKAQPRNYNGQGFEFNKRLTEDLRTLVVEREILTTSVFTDGISYVCSIPSNYMFFVSAEALISKEDCVDKIGKIYIVQHDDRAEQSPFDRSSFEWREVNTRMYEDKFRLFTDGTFTVGELQLNYLRHPAYIHAAGNFRGGSYTLPGSVTLTGFQDCELPEHTHREITDLAVLLLTGEMQIPDYQIKLNKIQLNN